MKVFLTGATGFLGGALAIALLAEGAEITALARQTANRDRFADLPIRWHTGDVTDPASLAGALGGFDVVVHAAGRLGTAGVPETDYHTLHVDGTRHLLAAVQVASPGARVLYVSSPGVLGPISSREPAGESAPLAPSNAYERSKAAAETVAAEFAAAGLPVIIVRPEFVYGPGDAHVLGLFQAVRRGLFFYIGRGRAHCHPTYVDDAVSGMLLALKKGEPGEVYHITGPRPVTFHELGTTFAAALGVRAPWLRLPRMLALLAALGLEGVGRLSGRTPLLSRDGVAFFSEDRRFSWQKARRQLGYEPKFDLAAGAAATVAWYRAQGWL